MKYDVKTNLIYGATLGVVLTAWISILERQIYTSNYKKHNETMNRLKRERFDVLKERMEILEESKKTQTK